MMFYRNTLNKVKKVKYQKIKLNFNSNFDCDNEYLNVDFPQYCINFDASNNQLSNSYGDSDFCCARTQNGDGYVYPEIGSKGMLKNLKYFVKVGEGISQKQMIVEDINSKVYCSSLDDGTTVSRELISLDENCDSKYFTYYHKLRNYLLISTRVDELSKLYVYDGNIVRTYENVPYIQSICTLNDYIFVSFEDGQRNSICFCDENNPHNIKANISQMKSIGLPVHLGKVQKLIDYEDYLYVICEYGIARAVFYKNQDSFSIEEVYMGTSKIVEGSIVKGADKIIFADIESIYILSGSNIEKLNLKCCSLFKDIYKFYGVACFDNGKYYFATRLGNYQDGIIDGYDDQKNNALIVYDINTKAINVCFDISIKDMDVYYDKAQSRVAILAGASMNYYLRTLVKNGIYNKKYPSLKYYKTHYFDCNNDDIKIIRNIKICTNDNIQLSIYCDGVKTKYDIDGSEIIQQIVINKKAKMFAVEIVANGVNPVIKSCEILVGAYQ